MRAGKIFDATGKNSLTYAGLAKSDDTAKLFERAIPSDVELAPVKEWKILGTPVLRPNARDILTGAHKYPSDIARPGMLYGKILRAPSFGAKLLSIDLTPAKAMKDVLVVQDDQFVGVTAPNSSLAEIALQKILDTAKWETKPQPSSKELFEYLKQNAAGGVPKNPFADEIAGAKVVSQTYHVPYIQHAPLEPRAAVAEWNDDKLTVWTGSQNPFGVRSELARAFHLPPENMRVVIPDFGGGFGGKHTGESAVEAARLAKGAGKLVSLRWTREEEFTWAYFRPAGVIEVKSVISPDGKLLAWDFHNYHSGSSGIETPYEVPNVRIAFHSVPLVLRSGSYRGLAATANHFARETHMDAVAHAAKIDPLEFRLKNLEDARLRAVLEAAAKSFGWPRTKAAGRGFGIAAGNEKGSYVATCAEIAVDNSANSVRVVRLVTAFECGAIVNPDGLRNQVIGANIQGLGGALFEAIEFDHGRITNSRFSRYRVPRFRDIPEIEAVLVDRKDIAPAGAGETPIMAVAPAIGNAIFNATKQRLNNLPLIPNGLPKV